MNTYSEVTDFLFSQLPMYQRLGKAAYKAGLETTLALDTHFNHPHKSYRTIHVAGTNGKGSVSHILASVLMEAGYKCGLYTSPHLKDFRERIKVDGEQITEKRVVRFVNQHRKLFDESNPSFFEMTVAMAFQYFKETRVDVAVIETGLGGRLDSTNIITPVLSVITNIGHDHQEFLGHSLEEIAGEKAGIIKPGVPVVVGETREGINGIFKRTAMNLNAPIAFADSAIQTGYTLKTLDSKQRISLNRNGIPYYKDLECDLLGNYQAANIITALVSIEMLRQAGIQIEEPAVYKGMASVISNTGFYGRWQVLDNNPLVVCDTGHNPEGMQQVIAQIRNTPHKKLHFILGMVSGKDPGSILNLLPKEASYYYVRADIPRAMDPSELQSCGVRFGLKGKVCSSVVQAVESARNAAGPDDLVFIGGSTYVVAEVV